MRYNVSQLLQEPVGSFREHELTGLLVQIDEQNLGPVPVSGHVTLIRTPKGILAKGEAAITLTEPCRRCLEPAVLEATLVIEEEYMPSIDVLTGATLPIVDEDDQELVIDQHHLLDLTEVLRQYALAEGTAGALCRSDCRGLCPLCGINRNHATCDCDQETIDPRLAILAQMLDDQERDETKKGSN